MWARYFHPNALRKSFHPGALFCKVSPVSREGSIYSQATELTAHSPEYMTARMSHANGSDLQAALAPAAGKGIGKMLFSMLLSDPEFVAEMKTAVMKGLRAQHTFRDRKTGEIITADDPRTMVATVAMILAQAEGEPIKRVIHQHIGAPGAVDVEGELQDSPALRAAVQRLLDKASFRTRPDNTGSRPARVAEPIDIE